MSNELNAQLTTLTASVTTIQIGTKQITQGMIAQLDTVGPENITPIGRVRQSKVVRESNGLVVEVIGTDPNGVLVKSAVQWSKHFEQDAHSTYIGNAISVYLGKDVDFDEARERAMTDDNWEWDTNAECIGNVYASTRAIPAHRDAWQAWNKLPLIVLSGLK